MFGETTSPRPQRLTLAGSDTLYPRTTPLGLLANVSEAKLFLRPKSVLQSLQVQQHQINFVAESTLDIGPEIALSFESNNDTKLKNRPIFRSANHMPIKPSLAAAPRIFIQIRLTHGSFFERVGV